MIIKHGKAPSKKITVEKPIVKVEEEPKVEIKKNKKSKVEKTEEE